MDVATISANAQGEVKGAVNIAMFKKARDFVASQAMDLIQAIPQSPSPAGVGGNVDVRG